MRQNLDGFKTLSLSFKVHVKLECYSPSTIYMYSVGSVLHYLYFMYKAMQLLIAHDHNFVKFLSFLDENFITCR